MAGLGAPQTQSSRKYMWSTRDRLGQGATGQVYLGYDRVIKINIKYFILVCFLYDNDPVRPDDIHVLLLTLSV